VRLGEVLNGYRVATEPTNAGAGMSQWAIAEKDGTQYFLKMYLAPKFPLPDSPGSEAGKERRREECRKFEQRQLTILRLLRPDVAGGGHLITTLEFFRVGTSYYKVTRLVPEEHRVALGDLSAEQRQIALRSLLFSLKILHDQHVVHGDLKLDNVLFNRTAGGAVTTKLIDFDEAYPSGAAPERSAIVGDPLYYSPELFRYIKDDPEVTSAQLTLKSDTFALGLLIHQMMTGRIPSFDTARFAYPCESVVAGVGLKLMSDALPARFPQLIARMVAQNPDARPGIDEVIAVVRGEAEVSSPVVAARLDPSVAREAGRSPGPGRPAVAPVKRPVTPAGCAPAGGVTPPPPTGAPSAGATPAPPVGTGPAPLAGSRLKSTFGRPKAERPSETDEESDVGGESSTGG
jgi:serine/threonine protein kinase